MQRVRPVATSAVILLTVSLAACASPSAPTTDLPDQDVARWVMPMDGFMSPALMDLPNYASNLLISECLGEEGIDWPIPWQSADESAYLAPTANLSGFQNLTVETAREHGYRAPSAPGSMGAPTNEQLEARHTLNAIAASTPGFEPLFDACITQARKELPDDKSATISNQLVGWSYEGWDSAQRDEAVQEAAAAWKSCLGDAGYPVDLASPIDPEADEAMPSQKLLEQLGIPSRYQPGDGGPENPLTTAEIDLAVADATCRQSSGWTDALYRAAWDAQVKTVQKHADELVRMRDEGRELIDDALKIIAAHAPAQ